MLVSLLPEGYLLYFLPFSQAFGEQVADSVMQHSREDGWSVCRTRATRELPP